MVSGIVVDAGADSAFAAYKKDPVSAKPAFPAGHGSYHGGLVPVYSADVYPGGALDGIDCLAAHLFRIPDSGGAAVSFARHVGQRPIQQAIPGIAVGKEARRLKTNIGFVNLDASLLQWLREALRTQAPDTVSRRDLQEGLESLADGTARSLMLELDEQTEPGKTPAPATVLRCGALVIDPRARSVQRAGQMVALTPKEFDILYFLARNRGEVFTKEQIYQAVWEGDYMLDDSNIMAFIRKLRKKIEPNPDAPEYIQTIWGIGYRFNESL